MRRFTAFTLSTVSFTALVLAAASPASAQGAAGDTPDPACANLPEGQARDACISGEVEIESGQAARSDDEIIVTGSRIRSPNLNSPVPVTSVSAQDLTSQGDVNIGDALNDLPSIRSTFSQANSTRFIGTAGVNLLDLRGLGTSRTLVLVNGRRHVTYTPTAFLVDVNTIPSDLIERVDVITGGSSAVYGSDAVAGVINFVLKRDFEGFRVRGQSGISTRGDRGIQTISVTAGQNLFDNRANVAVNLEYVNAEALYFKDRDYLTGAFSGRCQFNAADTDPASQPDDGVPDNQFFCGVRNATISNGGTLAAAGVNAVAPGQAGFGTSCQNPALSPTLAARCLFPGTPQGQPRIFRFDAAGNFLQDVPALDFRPVGSGNFVSNPNTPVPGSTLRDTGQLAPGLDRYTANLLFNMEITPALKPFAEVKFARVDALQEGQPSFFQGSFAGFFGGGRGIRCDNPFLDAADVTALQAIGRCAAGNVQVFDTRQTIVNAAGQTVTNPNFGADITETLPLSRFNVDFGARSEVVRRDTFRVVGGITGDFNDDWNYEVVLNYGRLKSRQTQLNDLQLFDLNGNQAGFLLATDAVRNSSGQIVCRVNADSNPTNDQPNCVPINVFGEGQPTQAALDFVNTQSFVKSRASQLNAVAFVSGDSSQLFELPGGPIRFVLGGEYRRETAFREADPLSSSGGTFFNAFQVFDPPKFEVKEVFGEVQVPIVRDLPFLQELTLSAAGRYSDYNTAADRTFAYNLNGTYAPIRDLRFRANYSKSVRVPTLGDLFLPGSQNFGFVSDPCDVLNIGNNPNRASNCAALGVPAGFVNTVARSQTIEFQTGGNPNLEEETGKSLTLGGVFTPRFVPGLSLTVDYYKIRVDNLIATLGAQTIINQCVDLPDIDNQFCQLIFPRQTDNPATPENETGLFAQPALLSSGINFARQEADGIDFELAYRRNFANGHRLNFRGIATYVLKRNNFISPTNPNFADRQLSELGDPQWSANANVTYGIGNFDFRYSVNYIGKQTIGIYENYFSVQDRPPLNADFTREVFYPDVLYHAARINFRLPATGKDTYNFYVGADNIFDTKPPLGLLGTSEGDPFDSIGRYVYAGFSVNF